MKPTIEEVKEYFKNAKEVKSVIKPFKGKLNLHKIYYNQYFKSDIWCPSVCGNYNILLYCSLSNQYAEIISYKEETVTVPKSLITELCKDKNVRDILVRNGVVVEETYIQIPLSEIRKTSNDAELGRTVRNIADKY